MATYKQPFGEPDEVKKADDNVTPQQKKFEKATGKDSDSAVGDVKKPAPTKPETDPIVPKGVNKEVWEQAQGQVIDQSGSSGVSQKGLEIQTQERYDKMVEQDKRDKEWAGKGGILGDI